MLVSDVRREPISTRVLEPAANRIQAPAEATAESWLSTDKINVSSSTASPKVASTLNPGDCGT